MKIYRKIWEDRHGPIPIDEEGRTYEIHHIDGNHKNNDINNLACMPIKEHYDTHYAQGDWGACLMIAKRMNLPSNYLSEIQKGKKRPGIGGRKPGFVSETKGKKVHSEDQKKKWSEKRKGKVHSKKFDEKTIKELLEKFVNVEESEPTKSKNGRYLSHITKFANENAEIYNMSSKNIIKIVSGKTLVWNHLFEQIVNMKS